MPRSPNHQRVVTAYREAIAREQAVGFNALNPLEQELIATLLMHEEIRNGGFLQWFTNSHSDYAGHALAFLQRVGAVERLELITKASSMFPKGKIPNTRRERCNCASMWKRSDVQKLEPLNDAYYAIKRDLYDDLVTLLSESGS